MAQIFKINDTTADYIQRADWVNSKVAEALDGDTARQRWVKHVWQGNVMDVDEFDTIFALEGQTVSITTTNYDDRNDDYLTYYGVKFLSIVSEHVSRIMENIRCEFLVRL